MANTPKPIRKALKRKATRSGPYVLINETWTIQHSEASRSLIRRIAKDSRRLPNPQKIDPTLKQEWHDIVEHMKGHQIDLSDEEQQLLPLGRE